MIEHIPPAIILILGALLIPLFRGPLKAGYMLLLPVLSLWHLWSIPPGEYWQLTLFDYSLTMLRIDRLSMVFGTIFHIAAFINVIYALHVKDDTQHVAG